MKMRRKREVEEEIGEMDEWEKEMEEHETGN